MHNDRINSLLRSKDILLARLQEIDTELNHLGHKEEYTQSPVDKLILSVMNGIMTMDQIVESVCQKKTYHEQYIRGSVSELINADLIHKFGSRGRGVTYCKKSQWEMIEALGGQETAKQPNCA